MSHPSPPGDWPPRRPPVESATEELPQLQAPAIPRQWTPPPAREETPHSYWDTPAPPPQPQQYEEPAGYDDHARYEEPSRFEERPRYDDAPRDTVPPAEDPAPPHEPTGSIRRKHAYTGHITRKGVAATVIAILAVALFVAAVLWGLNWLRDKSEKEKYDDYGATSSWVYVATYTQRRTPAADW
ncbi:hypothetical protein Afil01_07610 [Actinorhabdospora filicis]|uniref:Uncharacterized protein n=1 Tax=Actinorhabdospora filicis TaxID=1785913 RepID=A0A9W6SI74_9ACTN|nr:hypothetical protein [Actinorhabdospora filicis]GLZ75954.1 hypothetical protein Afil01_07610 [Actinorhabdospora filicis]